jgi:DNA-binding NtrC family response regulator
MSIPILVVDDDPLLVDLIELYLEETRYLPRSARNADEALAALRTDRFIRILLTDIRMPGKSGVELAVEVMKIRPYVGIIIMTGYAGLSQVPDVLPLLRKPFLRDDLVQMLDEVYRGSTVTGRSRGFIDQ